MEKKYIVKVINVFSNLIAVDANNEEEAKEKLETLAVDTPCKIHFFSHFFIIIV